MFELASCRMLRRFEKIFFDRKALSLSLFQIMLILSLIKIGRSTLERETI